MITTLRTVHINDGIYYDLSNYSAHQIKWMDRVYPTSEHLYQASKFLNSKKEGAVKAFQKILDADSPYLAKKAAHQNRDSYRSEWRLPSFKIYTMYKILSAKALQHADIRETLFKTGNRHIIEISLNDDFWGATTNGVYVTGENHLGFQWMRVRSEIWQQICKEFENKSA